MPFSVERTDDPARAFARCGSFLEQRPVEHNVALSVLTERLTRPHEGRYWWAADGERVVGYAWQSPTDFFAGTTPMPTEAARATAVRIAADVPDLPGVIGEAATAAAFAGTWTEEHGTGAAPVEGQRIYRLDAVVPVASPPGRPRRATATDIPRLTRWMSAFHAETGAGGATPDLEATVRWRIDEGWLWVWDADGVVATAMAVPSLAGASRIGFVYTPPDQRRHGYAQALVAHVSQGALATGASACLLYTQLDNATSNSIYRRVGYRAVSEVLKYAFAAA